MEQLTCIVCGYQPEPAFDGCEHNQPYKATAFNTVGHYGSTVFDSFGEAYLEINICDECLNKAVDKQQVLYYKAGNKNAKIYDRNVDEG